MRGIQKDSYMMLFTKMLETEEKMKFGKNGSRVKK